MPVLDDSHVQELLALAQIHRPCQECGQHAAQDYCRSHDVFYWLHAPGCAMHEDHGGCRLTIVPYVDGHRGEEGYKPPVRREIYFFPNGNTAVFHNGEQVPQLQAHPWVQLMADLLEQQGEDPTAYRLNMPNGEVARFFKTSEGNWNWRFEE